MLVTCLLARFTREFINVAPGEMQIIGLTGGIGTGKSSACRLLKEIDSDLVILDADYLSHEAVKVNKFPYLLLRYLVLPIDCFDRATGELKRSRVAELIFEGSDEAKRLKRMVELCIHPWINWKMMTRIIWCWFCGKGRIVLDIPLLFEAKLQWICTKTVLIDTSNPEIQMARILSRCPQMTAVDAQRRISSQFSMAIKRKLADCVIKNDRNDGFKKLKEQLEKEFSLMSPKDLFLQRLFYLYFPLFIFTLISIAFVKYY